jgi:hypothetical protein
MNPPIPWEAFARLQSQSNPRTVHARSAGREEAIETVLDDLVACRIPFEAQVIERRFDHLCANRATKHRRRARLLRGRSSQQRPQVLNPCRTFAVRHLMERIREVVQARDYRYLLELAEGRSYAEVAARHGLNEGTLKSRVARAREQARKAVDREPFLRALVNQLEL